jgi:hypothetical protein
MLVSPFGPGLGHGTENSYRLDIIRLSRSSLHILDKVPETTADILLP